ncbi:MAG: 50S ribosomal protein L10 [Bacteroidetes bacterium]|jgi:large subunit ribosomal protein L10|nr:50S ribosomal protein L10 [Bacteroidota bacterium]
MKTKEDKSQIIETIAERLNNNQHFYLTDISGLNAEDTSKLRRKCFEKDIQLMVVKNTLLKKAFEQTGGEYGDLIDILKNSTSVMFTNTGNAPARLIKEFRKGSEKPVLKGAFVEESVYIGDDQLEMLTAIKSKNELLGDLIGLLQSPIKNVVSQLQSGGGKIHGLLDAIKEKNS